jgi:PKD domain/Phosphate-induced protein 1 conserved region
LPRALASIAFALFVIAAIPSTTSAGAERLPIGSTGAAPDARPTGFSASTPAVGAHRSARAAPAAPLTYHGGPVQRSSAVYPIFWVPAGYALPAGYSETITTYFADVSHDSYQSSNVYSSIVQYYQTKPKRFVSYNITDRPPALDTRRFPKSGCPNYTLGDGTPSIVCLTRAQIRKEVARLVASHKIPNGLGTQIFLFTPQGVASCTTKTALAKGGCYNPLQYNGYCAFHSRVGSGRKASLYAYMPYNALPGCTSGQSPNGNAADSVLNNVAHEHMETMTDPLGNGWYDAAGREIADRCHLKFGKPLGSTPTGQYNQIINGHHYWLQMVWSNRAKACAPRNTFSQPKVSFRFSPSSPTQGKKVRFKSKVKQAGESKWTYRWTFPDGSTSKAANPKHVFKAFILNGSVALVVTDSKGNQTRIARTITVT